MAEDYEDVVYKVPLLPLIANSSLRIKEVEVQFDADLIGIEGTRMMKPRPARPTARIRKAPKSPRE